MKVKDESDKADLKLNIQKTKIMTSSSIMHVCMLSHFSHFWLFLTLWTVTHQAPLSMGFSRQKYWNVLPLSPPEGLLNSGIKPGDWGPLGLSINSAVDSQGQKLMEASGYSVSLEVFLNAIRAAQLHGHHSSPLSLCKSISSSIFWSYFMVSWRKI